MNTDICSMGVEPLLRQIYRLRVLIIQSSIVVFILLVYIASRKYPVFSYPWLELVDYSLWLLFSATLIVGFTEVKYSKPGYLLSTYLLAPVGLALTILGRLSSTMYTLIVTSFYARPIGGSIIDSMSYGLSLLIPIGTLLVSASASISTAFKRHIVLSKRVTIEDLVASFRRLMHHMLVKWTMLVAFTIGFLVRLYPETITPLPIGWDTIEYIAHALDYAYSPGIVTSYPWLGYVRNLPPLLTYLSGLSALAGLSPFIFYKVYPALLTGVLALISAAITHRLTGSQLVALTSAVALVFNPWILGQTYQWQRHILGLTLLMIYIYVASSKPRLKTRIGIEIPILILMAMSYELTCILAVIISLIEILRLKGSARAVYLAPLSMSILLLLFYAGYPSRPPLTLSSSGVSIYGGDRFGTAGLKYTIVSLLALAPFTPALTLLRKSDITIRTIMAVSLVLALSYNLFTVAIVASDRCLFLLMTIVTPYAVSSLYSYSRRVLALLVTILLLAGVAYVFTDYGYGHFNLWDGLVSSGILAGYPWRLSPAVGNLTMCSEIAGIISVEPTLSIMPLGIYPCIHLYIRNYTLAVNLWNNPSLWDVVWIINASRLSKVYVVTTNNLTSQIELVLNNTSGESSGSTSLGDTWFNIESLKCVELHKEGQYILYECFVS